MHTMAHTATHARWLAKKAPELAAGALLQCFTALWSNKVAALLSVNGDATALTPAESTQILEDLDAGRANMHLQLQSKLDFWSRLPWLLAGLAHTDEGKARLCASSALSTFDLDARESAHHRITWALLRPGKFRAAIGSFVAGAPRFSMPDYVLNVIASFRFIPVVETTIEGKHAKVALESPGFLGAVRVSLSNRFQVVERCLSCSVTAASFVRCFDQARRVRMLPALLGLASHPSLVPPMGGKRLPRNVFVRNLIAVFYRCDLENMFLPLGDAKREHLRQRGQTERLHRRLTQERHPGRPTAITEDEVSKAALLDHFRAVVCHDVLYSLPMSVASVEGLGTHLDAPGHKRARTELLVDVQELQEDNAQDFPEPVDEQGHVFFRVLQASPGSKKFVPIAPGAGGRMSADSLAVTVHTRETSLGDCVVNCRVSGLQDSGDPIGLLTGLTGAPAIEQHFIGWHKQPGLLYFIVDAVAGQTARQTTALSDLLTAMVHHRALTGLHASNSCIIHLQC